MGRFPVRCGMGDREYKEVQPFSVTSVLVLPNSNLALCLNINAESLFFNELICDYRNKPILDFSKVVERPHWGINAAQELYRKKSFLDISEINENGWKEKNVCDWESIDTLCWILHELSEKKVDYQNIPMDKFVILGRNLLNLNKFDFEQIDITFGAMLYHALQNVIMSKEKATVCYNNPCGTRAESRTNKLKKSRVYKQSEVRNKGKSSWNVDDVNLNGWTEKNIKQWKQIDTLNWIMQECSKKGLNYETIQLKHFAVNGKDLLKLKKSHFEQHIPVFGAAIFQSLQGIKLGSKNSGPHKVEQLWKFIRSLLHNRKYCPSHIRWENHEEGVFVMVKNKEIAKLWGTLRGNPDMSYEHLSRAMRYYYHKNIFRPVDKKLVYRFGPAATGWKSSNPNFELSDDR